MKKLLLTSAFMLLCIPAIFAQKYLTRTGKISFNATSPNSPEKIEAINNEAACITDAQSGEIVLQVLIKSFKFERALMQEHFNENYLESDKYPRADFKGSILNMKDVNLAKSGTYNVKVKGKLTIHGVSKDVAVPGTVSVNGSTISVKAKFSVLLADYGVTVPSVVVDKVSKEATINVDCDMAIK